MGDCEVGASRCQSCSGVCKNPNQNCPIPTDYCPNAEDKESLQTAFNLMYAYVGGGIPFVLILSFSLYYCYWKVSLHREKRINSSN